jgi:hypothetical protein
MKIAKGGLIGTFSAFVSVLTAVFLYTALENFSGIAKLCVVVLSGLIIGTVQGFFIEKSWHRAIGIGTFAGPLILWLPVVIVTYGFALLGLPLLAAFSTLVLFGAKLGAKLRMCACRRQ